ncbi:MAG: cysteine hydrolase [Chloroflexi bacterium]|nr:cysteine hydrolase [Chloroflexota bacterium]
MSGEWKQGLKDIPIIVPPFELQPQSTALLIVDMQYMFAHPDFGYARMLRSRYPRAADYFLKRVQDEVIPNHGKLLQFFRQHGLRVVYVTLGAALPDGSDMVPLSTLRSPDGREKARKYGRWLAAVGSPGHRILEEIAPRPNELVINKTSFGAFNSTGIDTALRNMGVEYLVITGVAANVCVETTARDAADRGYRCVMVEDAVAAITAEFQEVTMKAFASLFGRVETTEAVCGELQRKLHTAVE